MKIVIVGYGEMFNALITGVLNSGHEIAGVFRKENILYSPFRRLVYDWIMPSEDRLFVKSLGLNDIKAESVNSDKFIEEIKRLNTDIILVGSWGEKFSSKIIASPKIACINTHPSLLPKYRGANPYAQVILAGEKYSGITFHIMDENFDTGPVIHQAEVKISDYETGKSLKQKCCELARKEIVSLLKSFDEKIQIPIKQNEKLATYQKQLTLEDCILNFSEESSVKIQRRIRALTPWLKCHIPYKNEFFEFKKFTVYDNKVDFEPASIIKKTSNSIFIVCADRKIIEFSGLKLKRFLLLPFTKFYLKYFIKINSKAI